MLHRLFPLRTHGLIQDFRVNQGHFRAGMGHPLLHQNQAHASIQEFNAFRMSESMKSETKEDSFLVSNLIFFRQVIESLTDSSDSKRISPHKALTVELAFVFRCR